METAGWSVEVGGQALTWKSSRGHLPLHPSQWFINVQPPAVDVNLLYLVRPSVPHYKESTVRYPPLVPPT